MPFRGALQSMGAAEAKPPAAPLTKMASERSRTKNCLPIKLIRIMWILSHADLPINDQRIGHRQAAGKADRQSCGYSNGHFMFSRAMRMDLLQTAYFLCKPSYRRLLIERVNQIIPAVAI
jgi:hypothetical protein